MSEALYPIAIEVNGAKRTGHVTARTSLVDWLREHLQSHRHAYRLRARNLRRLLGHARRRAGPLLPDVCRPGERPSHHHGRGPGAAGRTVEHPAGQLLRSAWAAVRLLHAGHADRGAGAAERQSAADRRRNSRCDRRQPLPLHRLSADRRGHCAGGAAHGRGDAHERATPAAPTASAISAPDAAPRSIRALSPAAAAMPPTSRCPA